jgi:peroxiredoxin family protein
VSIIVSKGSLDGIYPGLIKANGARMEGNDVNLFFTFFGSVNGILKKYNSGIKIATVGNPAMRVPDAKGLPLPTLLGLIPGMSAFATWMMKREMDQLDIPPIPEMLEMIHDAGGRIFACKATVDMFHLTPEDFCPQVEKVLTVGEFYELSAGAQIIFT